MSNTTHRRNLGILNILGDCGFQFTCQAGENVIAFETLKLFYCFPIPSSRAGINYSDRLDRMISNLNEDWKQLLAECQYSFVCFLMGQVFEGFEQWKRLIHLLCSSTTALQERNDLYMQFNRVLYFQLKECPEDFFIDIVSKDNFLTTTLSMLFANIRDGPSISTELKRKSLTFKEYLTKTFKWDFDIE